MSKGVAESGQCLPTTTKPWVRPPGQHKADVVTTTPAIPALENRDRKVRNSRSHGELEVSLRYRRPCLKKSKV